MERLKPRGPSQTARLSTMIPKPTILLLSGGLDSVTLAYDLVAQGCIIHALEFDYGQTHLKELQCADYHANKLKLKRTRVELHRIKGLFSHSALTDGKGGVIVPNRNAVFVHIAASIAVTAGAESVVIGCNQDDQDEFPDCRWDWLSAMNLTLHYAEIPVEVCGPYMGMNKKEVVRRAKELCIDLNKVWWCYKGGENSCGECGACKKMEAACA